MKSRIYDVLKCSIDDNVVDVARMIKENQARHVFVVDDNDYIKGILSTVDLSNSIADGKDMSALCARDVMNPWVDTVEKDERAEFALKIMMQRNTLSCPVTRNRKLVGCVNYFDVFREVGFGDNDGTR